MTEKVLEDKVKDDREVFRVDVQLISTSKPIVYENVIDTYEKGSFYCLRLKGDNGPETDSSQKYPIKDHIFRVHEYIWGKTR